jgi:hypothetical protein
MRYRVGGIDRGFHEWNGNGTLVGTDCFADEMAPALSCSRWSD